MCTSFAVYSQEKTIQSLDGFLSNNKIQFTKDEIFVKDLISLYK